MGDEEVGEAGLMRRQFLRRLGLATGAGLGVSLLGDLRAVYFAGEHVSLAHSWMQGALESALIAGRAMLARG